MNKPIRTISVFCLFLFLGLMVNATYLQYYKADDLGDDPRNRRVIVESFSGERGGILVDRDTVAESVEVDDQYEFQRQYPQPFKYAHLTGWFSYYSQTGVEQSQNAVLSGDDDRLFVARLGDLLSNAAPKGGSVQLTIDPAAQTAMFDGLRNIGAGTQAAGVAIEPSTGRILASVSLPSYDPNRLASHDFGSVADAYEELQEDETEPLLNRAIQTRLPPGSTFKIVTAAAAIESGNYTTSDAMVPGGAEYTPPQTSNVIDNEGRDCGSGRIPFTQAMGQSCNTSFAALANEVGAQGMLEQAEAFGFNSQYLEDLGPQAESGFPEDEELSPAFVAQTGIGQYEVASTPLQMAMVVSGIANAGVVMRPYVVDEVRSPELDVLDKTDPEELSQAVSAETAGVLTDLMVYTVSQGTATPAIIPGVDVAGKTGTAQSGIPSVPPYAWFVSFAPADDPQVAVAIMIQKADVPRGEIAGGRLAGPIAKSVMEAVIQ